jgi:hypothetical protein
MIRRFLVLMVVSGVGFGSLAGAADLPTLAHKREPKPVKAAIVLKKRVAKPQVVEPARASDLEQDLASRPASAEPITTAIDMSWVLDPLVANADGAKTEDSASVEGNLIVVEPGQVTAPGMIIELTGHLVKTPHTTARIDVQVGSTRRTISWRPDDVQAGKFKIELNATMPEGELPAYLPVSALAFVTNERKGGAVMVSLEKILVRVGQVALAQSQ